MATKSGQGKYKKMTMSPKEYKAFAKTREPSRSILANCIRAFLVGGFICIIGQAIQELFVSCIQNDTDRGKQSDSCGAHSDFRYFD